MSSRHSSALVAAASSRRKSATAADVIPVRSFDDRLLDLPVDGVGDASGRGAGPASLSMGDGGGLRGMGERRGVGGERSLGSPSLGLGVFMRPFTGRGMDVCIDKVRWRGPSFSEECCSPGLLSPFR